MLKKYSKKVVALSFIFISMFALVSTVYASYHYYLENEGQTVMEYSDSELSGNIYVKATFQTQLYNGELTYQLQKKGLFGYSNVGSKQTQSTYRKSQDQAWWYKNPKTMYRGFIELSKKDTNSVYAGLSGYLSVGENNH